MGHRGRRSKGSARKSARGQRLHTERAAFSTTVGGMAAAAGVAPHVVRYYARIGLLEPDRDPANNYKRFTERHLQRVLFIRRAKALGYTLDEIKQIIHHASHGRSPCPDVRDIIRRRIDENRERLRDMQRLQRRMEQALQRWKSMPDRAPSGDSVCHLIESIEVG